MTSFAMLFPGQGSQSVGMLGELAGEHQLVRQTFDEAGSVLGIDLWDIVCNGPAEDLNQTEITQPAMLAGGVAVWRVWQDLGGGTPDLVAGHSLGEYTALVAAGVLNFPDAVRLVAERARLMQAAVATGEGAMAAILGLDDEVVEAICREVAEGQIVAPANYNSPGQLVIAGDAAAVERAIGKCLDAGARRALPLPVSVPSHCRLMAPAANGLAEALDKIELNTPAIKVLHNVDADERALTADIRTALIEQLSSPVRWTQTIRAMVAGGMLDMIECGPGKVLSGLGRRIDRQTRWHALEQAETVRAASSQFSGS